MLEDFLILLIFPADVILQGFDEDEPAGDDCAEGLGATKTKHHTTFNTQKINSQEDHLILVRMKCVRCRWDLTSIYHIYGIPQRLDNVS